MQNYYLYYSIAIHNLLKIDLELPTINVTVFDFSENINAMFMLDH